MRVSNLVQKVKWNLDGSNTEMYMYGEADFEANKVMQEPLEKLYQYENRHDMRENIKEYISKLEVKIKGIEKTIINSGNEDINNILRGKCQILQKVINDLKDILEKSI